MVLFVMFDLEFILIIGMVIVVVGYGMLLVVFLLIMVEFYGLKNYGINYGVFYILWGIGGVIGVVVVGYLMIYGGGYNLVYIIFVVMMVVCIFFVLIIKFILVEKVV